MSLHEEQSNQIKSDEGTPKKKIPHSSKFRFLRICLGLTHLAAVLVQFYYFCNHRPKQKESKELNILNNLK